MTDDSNDGTNFPHKLLLTDRQASRLCKTFVNNSSANKNDQTFYYLILILW